MTPTLLRHLHRSHSVPVVILARQFGMTAQEIRQALGKSLLREDILRKRRLERMRLEWRLTPK